MPTSAVDRLNTLLENRVRPPKPDLATQGIADNLSDYNAQTEQQQIRLPEVAQYPMEAPHEPPQIGQCLDQTSISDDDDDYVAAFQKKPITKPALSKTPVRSKGSTVARLPASTLTYRSGNHSPSPISGREEPIHDISNKIGKTLLIEDGDGNSVTGQFCVFQLVAKFPYKYMVDQNDRVSHQFFADNKFYNRSWDLYYIHPPASLHSKAMLLLPSHQVQSFLDTISKAFDTELRMPPEPFILSFSDDGTPQPKFLGTSKSRNDVATMQESIPPASDSHGMVPPGAPLALELNFAAYKIKCERALAANKTKRNAVSKKKKSVEPLVRIYDGGTQLRRVQRYLGVRPRTSKPAEPDPAMSWDKQEQFRKDQLKKCGLVLEPLDVNQKAPHPFDHQPVIVCVDIESYERAHHLITEVGVSTLDTLDLVDLPLGRGGDNWIKQIRSRHFRVKGREYLINKDFCIGDPGAFQFGESEFVKIEDAPNVVDNCFKHPFSIDFKHDGKAEEWDFVGPGGSGFMSEGPDVGNLNTVSVEGIDTHGPSNVDHDFANKAVVSRILGSLVDPSLLEFTQIPTPSIASTPFNIEPKSIQRGPRDRKIIVLGHDIANDLVYLQQLGSKIFCSSRPQNPIATAGMMGNELGRAGILASILEALDTAHIYKALRGDEQTSSLAKILAGVGREAWFLHNAGNDARYTLESLIAMVVKARLDDDNSQAKKEAEEHRNEKGNDVPRGEPEDGTPESSRNEVERLFLSKELTNTIVTMPPDCCTRGVSNGVNTRGIFATSLPIIAITDSGRAEGAVGDIREA